MSTCATLAQAPVSPLAPASPRHDTKTTSPGLRPSSAQTRRRELLPSFVNTGDIDRDTDNPPHLAAVLGSLHGLAIHGPGEVGRARARPVAGEAARSACRGHGSSEVTGHLAAWALSSLTSKLSPMEEAGRTEDSQGMRLDQSQAEQEAAHTSNTGTWASVGGSGGHHNYHCIYLHHSHLCICTQVVASLHNNNW